MFESIFGTAVTDTAASPDSFLISMAVALLTGILVSMVYIKTHKTGTPTQSFALTLVILPVVITVIILLVGNSVSRAFSLAGAFAIIRFRSAPGDPKDITYVLFTMAIGLALGMGYLLYGVVIALILCCVMIVLHLVKFGQGSQSQRILRIMMPENLDYCGVFDDIFERYTKHYQRVRVRTVDLGSLYEVQYVISVSNNMNEKAFIDELRCRNGNLNITLLMDASENEF
jgi:hypothetical protein